MLYHYIIYKNNILKNYILIILYKFEAHHILYYIYIIFAVLYIFNH